MNYLSHQLCSQLCVSTIHVSCAYAATRRVVRARAGGPPGPGRVCVSGGSNVGQSLSTHAGQPVSACSAVQCTCRYNCVVWPCSRHAMSRYMQLRRSAVVTLMTSATAAVAVTLGRASPCACMRVYTYICVYNTIHYID